MDYGRQADDKKDDHDEGYADDEEEDGSGTRGASVIEFDSRDAVDDGHQDSSEECADVDDQEFFLEGPGQGEEEQNAYGKDDVAADGPVGFVRIGNEGGRLGGQRALL